MLSIIVRPDWQLYSCWAAFAIIGGLVLAAGLTLLSGHLARRERELLEAQYSDISIEYK